MRPTRRRARAQGHIPRTYNGSVGDAGLGDVTIGVLTPLFGTAPEDEEVGRDRARRARRPASARRRHRRSAVPGARRAAAEHERRSTRSSSSTCSISWRSTRRRRCTHSTRFSSSGKYHPAVETVLKRASEVTSRESADATGATLAKRETARQAVLEADERPRRHGVRVSDASPQAGGDRSAAGWIELPAQCDDRAAGDQHAGGVHEGRPAGWNGIARETVERADAVEGGVRVRAARCASPRRRRRRRRSERRAEHQYSSGSPMAIVLEQRSEPDSIRSAPSRDARRMGRTAPVDRRGLARRADLQRAARQRVSPAAGDSTYTRLQTAVNHRRVLFARARGGGQLRVDRAACRNISAWSRPQGRVALGRTRAAMAPTESTGHGPGCR